jgi:nucleoside 2-deoxyribosyltransferase
MNIYLAAPWVDKDLMPERAEAFKSLGHTITFEWWHHDSSLEGDARDEFREQCAEDDYNGVADADVVVLFHTAKSEGKATEQGIALALGIPIIAIGQRGHSTAMNIFHWKRGHYIWVDNIADAQVELGRMD